MCALAGHAICLQAGWSERGCQSACSFAARSVNKVLVYGTVGFPGERGVQRCWVQMLQVRVRAVNQ